LKVCAQSVSAIAIIEENAFPTICPAQDMMDIAAILNA
jgi:hypothetical protein